MFSFNFASAGDDDDAAPPAQVLLDARELSLTEEADASAWPIETVRGCACKAAVAAASSSSKEATRTTTTRRVTASAGAGAMAGESCALCGFVPLQKHVVPESRVPDMLAAGEAAAAGGGVGCGAVGELRESLRASDLGETPLQDLPLLRALR